MSGEGHVPHPACEGGWRPESAPVISDDLVRSIRERIRAGGERPSVVPWPTLGRRRGPYDLRHSYHPAPRSEPRWAFVDPGTGRLLSTAETGAVLRRWAWEPLLGSYDRAHDDEQRGPRG